MVGWWGDYWNQLGVIKTNLECHSLLFFAFNHRELHLCIFIFEKKVFNGAHALFYIILFPTGYRRDLELAGPLEWFVNHHITPLRQMGSLLFLFLWHLTWKEGLSESRWGSLGVRWEHETSSVGLTNPEKIKAKLQKLTDLGGRWRSRS